LDGYATNRDLQRFRHLLWLNYVRFKLGERLAIRRQKSVP